jgi:hypothetical protein
MENESHLKPSDSQIAASSIVSGPADVVADKQKSLVRKE